MNIPTLEEVKTMTRNDIVPLYVELIKEHDSDKSGRSKQMNDVILSKWTKSGLIYIKEEAWKIVERTVTV